MPEDESRRANDTVIFSMSTQIGQIQGKLDNALLNQDSINKRLVDLLEKSDARVEALDSADPKKMGRVTDLENSRSRAIAYLISAAFLGGGMGGTVSAWAGKILSGIKVIGGP